MDWYWSLMVLWLAGISIFQRKRGHSTHQKGRQGESGCKAAMSLLSWCRKRGRVLGLAITEIGVGGGCMICRARETARRYNPAAETLAPANRKGQDARPPHFFFASDSILTHRSRLANSDGHLTTCIHGNQRFLRYCTSQKTLDKMAVLKQPLLVTASLEYSPRMFQFYA